MNTPSPSSSTGPSSTGPVPTSTARPVSRVLVLAGGLSHERDVSVRSGRRLAAELRSAGLEVDVHDVDAQLLADLELLRPDVVWPVLHGATGEDGSVRDVLEVLEVPYVGTGPLGSRLAWDKAVTKNLLQQAGLSTPGWVTLQQGLFRELGAQPVLAAVGDRLGFPLVVKPAQGGSALGVSLVTEPSQLPRALVQCFAYGDDALIERAVSGTEVAVSLVERDGDVIALPAVEIVTDGAYDYDARYNPGRSEYYVPARLTDAQAERVAHAAVTAFRTLGLRDIGRVDLIVDADGVPQVLEADVAPGMTETSLFPQAVRAAGLTLPTMYRELAESAVRDRPGQLDQHEAGSHEQGSHEAASHEPGSHGAPAHEPDPATA